MAFKLIRVEIWRSMVGRKLWYGRVKARNGQIVWQTQGYRRKAGVENAVELLRKMGACEVVTIDA